MGNTAKVVQEPAMDRNLFNKWFDDRMAKREAAHNLRWIK